MNDETPRREGRQGFRQQDEPRASVAEGITVVAARWFQLAAIFWLTLLSPRFRPALPPLVSDALYWISWLAMAVGSFAMIVVALRRPTWRGGLIRSIVLLWLLLAIMLAF